MGLLEDSDLLAKPRCARPVGNEVRGQTSVTARCKSLLLIGERFELDLFHIHHGDNVDETLLE
jgi:hypothetical protein